MDNLAEKNRQSYNANAKWYEDEMKHSGGHKFIEKPAMEKEMPDTLKGQSVLCIGVGSGEELKEIIRRQPASVVGIDISDELLKIATLKYPSVEFKQMDMTQTSFVNEEFDFIYSSLTFHYAPDWDVLLLEIHRLLKRGGTLLFSTHNPDHWGLKPTTGNQHINQRGVTLTEHTTKLCGVVEVTFYNHRDQDSIKDALEHAGFRIEAFYNLPMIDLVLEGDELSSYKAIKEKNDQSPLFLLIKATKI